MVEVYKLKYLIYRMFRVVGILAVLKTAPILSKVFSIMNN